MIAQLETPIFSTQFPSTYKIEGLIQVFTGTQRNFFTGTIAQALNIAGHGTPVLVVQFLKGGIKQGPSNPVKLGQNLDWLRCNLPRCIDTPHLDESEKKALQELWTHTQEVILGGQYSLVVLDELSLAIDFGLIPEAEVIALIEKRPIHVDIILTGPNMPSAILDLADQVTDIRRSHQP
jgi:cob(I)alamin adenosyltransferase